MSASTAEIACSRLSTRRAAAASAAVGFWTKKWRDELVYEVGWMVVPEFRAVASRWRRPRRR